MRVLVCGSRDSRDREAVYAALDALRPAPELIICGGAPGVDRMAIHWAHRKGIASAPFAANWSKYGRQAGPIRNAWMLRHGKPDFVLAFPGGRGTADMVAQAEAAGVEVRRVDAPTIQGGGEME